MRPPISVKLTALPLRSNAPACARSNGSLPLQPSQPVAVCSSSDKMSYMVDASVGRGPFVISFAATDSHGGCRASK